MKNIMKDIIKRHPILLTLSKRLLFRYRQFGSMSKWKSLAKKQEIKLELGSGSKYGENGWTTIDIGNADISWDLRKGIPLANGSVKRIYSSHLLEHIPYHQLLIFLRECQRVLSSDGEFSVCVPNFQFYIDAYKEGKLFSERNTWWQPGLIDTGSVIDQLNYVAYMKDEHKYMFDEENLVKTLLKAGFTEARLRKFDETVDLLERKTGSIYAIAKK